MSEHVDRLYLHCKELVTLTDGPPVGARRRSDLANVGLIEDGAVAVRAAERLELSLGDGTRVALSPGKIVLRCAERLELDCSGKVMIRGTRIDFEEA